MVSRVTGSLKATLAFLSGLFSHRQWSLLEEHHERRVSPFIPSPTSDPALSVLDICVKAPAYVSESRAAGRPFSDATLVSSQGHASSDDTNISLFVNVPGFAPSEKDVTDAFRTGKSSRARVWTADQMDNDSYPSVLSARAGHRDPFPIFSTGSSSLPV
ncbi:hypothetical protein K439DRAFT_57737 [Ramaria rubella]|nr:hypothetical protein K439DRAFT_57737 [Ramaria rubella]